MALWVSAVCACLPVASHLTKKNLKKPLGVTAVADGSRAGEISQPVTALCSAVRPCVCLSVSLSWTNLSPRGWASCLLGPPGAFPSDALSAEAGLYLQACVKGSMATERRLVKTLHLNLTLGGSTRCYVRKPPASLKAQVTHCFKKREREGRVKTKVVTAPQCGIGGRQSAITQVLLSNCGRGDSIIPVTGWKGEKPKVPLCTVVGKHAVSVKQRLK